MNNIDITQVTFLGRKLVRPECVLATKKGNLYVSDFRGGVSQIKPDGTCDFFGGNSESSIEENSGILKPNGICLLPDGCFLAAHLGTEQGGIYKISRRGEITPFLLTIDDIPLPPCNFIYLDHQSRLWLTVSTTTVPRDKAYRSDVSNGFIAVIDKLGARVVADDIGYTNETYVTPDGKTLYVNATFSRETLAYDISDKNTLSNRRVVGSFGDGIFPDGLTMDSHGKLWITSIVSNSVLCLDPKTGESTVVLRDANEDHVAWAENAYQRNALGREHLDTVKSQGLKNISSLAFGGPRRSTIFLGCLLGDAIAKVESGICGAIPAHWEFDS